MLSILSQKISPQLNIATEEYLLKNFSEDVIFLYRNEKSIIVGKHQNTLAEINFSFTKKNEISTVRRLSGGGTVFHDLGNINFCFITSGAKNELVNFSKFTAPIIAFLKTKNIPATFGGRNDILIEGKKISGNACHVFKSRVMHHGTLLFDSHLEKLTEALKNDPLKFKDKAVKSVRSKVTNIKDYLKNKELTPSKFIEELHSYLEINFQSKSYTLEDKDYIKINKLVAEKYDTWLWNYGYSPNYLLKRRIKSATGKRFEIQMQIKKGEILDVNIKSNSQESEQIKKLENLLKGLIHKEEDLSNALKELISKMHDITLNELLNAIF